VWHSETDRAKYGNTVAQFTDAWLEAEQMSVIEGIRDLCLQPISQPEYMAFLPWAHDNGLHVRVKRFAGMFQGFSNYYTAGTDLLIVAMSRNKDMAESADPEQFLGYPKCCQEFFGANFPKYVDPVLQWAGYESHITASPYCIPVLRSKGIRFVAHIPCSPNCEATIKLGREMSTLLDPVMVEQALEILSAPITWDSYRSIAIVKTPWFRTLYRSVPYAEKVVVNINAGTESVSPEICAA
jgi:hypothetical protein